MSRLITLAAILANFISLPAIADDPPNLDAVLAQWEEASEQCCTFDAKMERFEYDGAFGHRVSEGRLYFEAPGQGRLDTGKIRGQRIDGFEVGESIVWNATERLMLQPGIKKCTALRLEEVGRLYERGIEAANAGGFWSHFGAGILYGCSARIDDLVPLTFNIRTAQLRQRYDLSCGLLGDRVCVTATPKVEIPVWREYTVRVLFDPDTHLTAALELSQSSGYRTVMSFTDVKINQVPADREELMNPDLKRYELLRISAKELLGEEK